MKTFDNVASLKLARLNANQFVETGGFTEKGGTGAKRYFTKTVAQAAADGDVIDDVRTNFVLANGIVAIDTSKSVIEHYTLAEAKVLTGAVIGQIIQITDRGNSQFEAVSSITNPPDEFKIIQGQGSIAWDAVFKDSLSGIATGVPTDGASDCYSAIQALERYELPCHLPDNYTYKLSQAVTIKGTQRNIKFLGNYVNTGSGTNTFKFGDTSESLSYSDITLGDIDGVDQTNVGVKYVWATLNNIVIGQVKNCATTLLFRQESDDTRQIHNETFIQESRESIKGIWHQTPPVGVTAFQNEGNIFRGGQIVGSTSTHGILFDSGVQNGGCFFYLGAVDCSNGVNYENNMDPTTTSANANYGWIPDTPADKPNIWGDDFNQNLAGGTVFVGAGLDISGNKAFGEMFVRPLQTRGEGTQFPSEPDNGIHDKGVRISGDSVRYKGGQSISYGGENSLFPGGQNLLTPNAAKNTEIIRLEVSGNIDLADMRLRDSTILTDDVSINAFNGTSAEDGVVINGSSNTGLPSNISIQRDGTNLYVTKPAGFSAGEALSFRVGGTGGVGSIVINPTSVSYNTTSEPRLKNFIENPSDTEINEAFNKIFDSFGVFTWNHVESAELVWGFDAHKAIDSGLGFGTEGEGPRDLAIGDVYKTTPATTKLVKRLISKVDFDGNEKQVEVEHEVNVPEIKHTVKPASVDQSKIVPYLVAKIEQLERRINKLEPK